MTELEQALYNIHFNNLAFKMRFKMFIIFTVNSLNGQWVLKLFNLTLKDRKIQSYSHYKHMQRIYLNTSYHTMEVPP